MSTFRKFLVIGTVSSVSLFGAGVASAATHTAPSASSHVATAHVLKVKKVAFKATIKGSMALLWNASSVTASSVSGKGTATLLGATTLKGNGTAPFTGAAQCEPMNGNGILTGAGSKLMLRVTPSAAQAGQACGADQSAPTVVTVTKGVAKVTGGTGKYKGASGTLSYKAVFSIQSTTSGSHESDSFTTTLTGTLTIKS